MGIIRSSASSSFSSPRELPLPIGDIIRIIIIIIIIEKKGDGVQ